MTQATYEDVNLILKLYELRREEKMREARQWFVANFYASTPEEANQIAPPGSGMHAYFRMVTSYWEMAASFVTSGVLNQDLFFQSNGELLLVWERVRALAPGQRESFKNPRLWKNLETAGNAYATYIGEEAHRAFVERLGKPPQKQK